MSRTDIAAIPGWRDEYNQCPIRDDRVDALSYAWNHARAAMTRPTIQDYEPEKIERFVPGDYVRWRIGTEAWADAEVKSVSTPVYQQVCELAIRAVSHGWSAVWAIRAPKVGDTEHVGAHCLKHICRPPDRRGERQAAQLLARDLMEYKQTPDDYPDPICGSRALVDSVSTFPVHGDPTCRLSPNHKGDHRGDGLGWNQKYDGLYGYACLYRWEAWQRGEGDMEIPAHSVALYDVIRMPAGDVRVVAVKHVPFAIVLRLADASQQIVERTFKWSEKVTIARRALTPLQLEAAREEWRDELRRRLKASARAGAARKPSVVCDSGEADE